MIFKPASMEMFALMLLKLQNDKSIYSAQLTHELLNEKVTLKPFGGKCTVIKMQTLLPILTDN